MGIQRTLGTAILLQRLNQQSLASRLPLANVHLLPVAFSEINKYFVAGALQWVFINRRLHKIYSDENNIYPIVFYTPVCAMAAGIFHSCPGTT